MTTTLAIDSITVTGRHRTDLGDVQSLADSINEVGLIHPIVVMPDNRLVAGERRLAACRLLGFSEVPVTVARTLSELALLVAERDENTCRKEMTPSELVSLTEAYLEIERPKAKERQAAGLKQNVDSNRSAPEGTTVRAGVAEKLAAKAAGWSRTSHQRVKLIIDTANDENQPEAVRAVAREALAEVDAGKPISPAAEKVARAKIVHGKDGAPKRHNEAKRADQVQALADRRYTADQIAAELRISSHQVRKVAKANGITLVRTGAVHRGRKNPADVVEHIVVTAAGLALGLDDIDIDDIDPPKADEWATSLSGSIKSLNRIARALKEMARVQEYS